MRSSTARCSQSHPAAPTDEIDANGGTKRAARRAKGACAARTDQCRMTRRYPRPEHSRPRRLRPCGPPESGGVEASHNPGHRGRDSRAVRTARSRACVRRRAQSVQVTCKVRAAHTCKSKMPARNSTSQAYRGSADPLEPGFPASEANLVVPGELAVGHRRRRSMRHLSAGERWSVRDRQGRWAGAHACSGSTCIWSSHPRPTRSFTCLGQGRRLGPLPKAWTSGRYEHGHGRIMRAKGGVRCMPGNVQAAFDICLWLASNSEDLGRSASFSLSAGTCCKARTRLHRRRTRQHLVPST